MILSRVHSARMVRMMMTLLAWLVPAIGSTILFLVLYNNLSYGVSILLSVILVNAVVLVIPNAWSCGFALSAIKRGSVCVIAVFGTVLVLELLFPAMWPQDYARIRDLLKTAQPYTKEDLQWFPVVFTNGFDQRVQPAGLQSGQDNVALSWHKPGAEFEYYGYEPNEKFKYLNIIRWNSHGYYDREYPYAKPPDVYRMVLIGDSYVEAMQVPLNVTFHKLLEQHLNQQKSHAAGAPRCEVIALGAAGTGLEHYLNVLKSEAVHYSPDLVAIALSGHEFYRDDPALSRERALALGDVTTDVRGLVRHGYSATAFALRRWYELQMNRIKISPELLQWSAQDSTRIEAAWLHTLEVVRTSRDLCASRGIGFVLLYVGSELEVKYALNPQGTLAGLRKMHRLGADFGWDMTKTENRISRYCKEHNIFFISLLEPLVRAQRETGKAVFGDHYSIFGHEVAAAALEVGLRPCLQQALNRRESSGRPEVARHPASMD